VETIKVKSVVAWLYRRKAVSRYTSWVLVFRQNAIQRRKRTDSSMRT